MKKVFNFIKFLKLAFHVDSINWEISAHYINVVRVVANYSKLGEGDRARAVKMMMDSWARERRVRKMKLLREMVALKRG